MDSTTSSKSSCTSLEDEILYLREENARLRRGIQEATNICEAVVNGDLKQTMTMDDNCENDDDLLKLRETTNRMVGTLRGLDWRLTQYTENALYGEPLCFNRKWEGLEKGIWKDIVNSVERVVAMHLSAVRSVGRVAKAVATGDLSKLIEMDASGETLDMKNIVNTMVYSLQSVASEVIRTNLEIGTVGILGTRSEAPQLMGIWAELSRNVNKMSSTVTDFVRATCTAVTAIAQGNLTQKIDVEFEGEMASFKATFNSMLEMLVAFARGIESLMSGLGETEINTNELQGIWLSLATQIKEAAITGTFGGTCHEIIGVGVFPAGR